jgi:aminoglycoside phosphotransferase (APT) family kinase protein
LCCVPRIAYRGEPSAHFPHPFVGHKLIPGVAADDPRVPESQDLANDIGRVLARVHSIPRSAADCLGMRIPANSCRAPFEELRRLMRLVPQVNDFAPDACAWVHMGPVVPPDYDGLPRFIHADFSPDHIIVNPATGRLSGIIDWGPAWGDPAHDFSYLVLCRGRSFLQRAVNAYALPVDDRLIDRAVFLARVRALGWVLNALRRHEDPTSPLETVRRAFAVA